MLPWLFLFRNTLITEIGYKPGKHEQNRYYPGVMNPYGNQCTSQHDEPSGCVPYSLTHHLQCGINNKTDSHGVHVMKQSPRDIPTQLHISHKEGKGEHD